MGELAGFLEYERLQARYRPVTERVRDWQEVALEPAPEELAREGTRCMDCGASFCHFLGCPLANLIPEWNHAASRGLWREAWHRLEMTNPFPEITGRICPAPCEAACTLSVNSAPVAVRQLERSIVERAFSEGWVQPQPPRRELGLKAAVIGSGPCGLTAAQTLRRRGFRVSLFEKSERLGGLLRYGIPDFKLDKGILDRRLRLMAAEGLEFETGVVIGEELSLKYLQKKFDAILLCLGAGQPRDLSVPGRGYEGILFALDYLAAANRAASGEQSAEPGTCARDKRVLVIGGGDTGADCVGTAIRQQARSVLQLEILPQPPLWKEPFNPQWPRWPNILRSSTSHEEGGTREWGVSVTRFSGGYDPRVQRASLAKVEWKPGRSGRLEPVEIPGSERELEVDLVLLAMGFVHVEHSRLLNDLEIALDARGNIAVDQGFRTSREGIFAAGDAVCGATLAVNAMAQGRGAAEAVAACLA